MDTGFPAPQAETIEEIWPEFSSGSLPQPEAATRRETPVDIAVLIPCYNEEMSIGREVSQFRAVLPHARSTFTTTIHTTTLLRSERPRGQSFGTSGCRAKAM